MGCPLVYPDQHMVLSPQCWQGSSSSRGLDLDLLGGRVCGQARRPRQAMAAGESGWVLLTAALCMAGMCSQ